MDWIIDSLRDICRASCVSGSKEWNYFRCKTSPNCRGPALLGGTDTWWCDG